MENTPVAPRSEKRKSGEHRATKERRRSHSRPEFQKNSVRSIVDVLFLVAFSVFVIAAFVVSLYSSLFGGHVRTRNIVGLFFDADWIAGGPDAPDSRRLRLGTYNIGLNASENATVLPWAERRRSVASTLLWEDFDLIALQGLNASQLGDLTHLLRQYAPVRTLDELDSTRLQSVLLYKTSRLRLLSSEMLPDRATALAWFRDLAAPRSFLADFVTHLEQVELRTEHSRNESALARSLARALPRSLVQYIITHSAGTDTFFVVAPDLSARSKPVRHTTARVILDFVNSRLLPSVTPQKLVFLLGDLYAREDEGVYRALTAYKYEDAKDDLPYMGPLGTNRFVSFLDARREIELFNAVVDNGHPRVLYGDVRAPNNTQVILYADTGAADNRIVISQFGTVPNVFQTVNSGLPFSDKRLIVADVQYCAPSQD